MLMLGVHYLDVSGSGNPMPAGTACVLGSIIKFIPPPHFTCVKHLSILLHKVVSAALTAARSAFAPARASFDTRHSVAGFWRCIADGSIGAGSQDATFLFDNSPTAWYLKGKGLLSSPVENIKVRSIHRCENTSADASPSFYFYSWRRSVMPCAPHAPHRHLVVCSPKFVNSKNNPAVSTYTLPGRGQTIDARADNNGYIQ